MLLSRLLSRLFQSYWRRSRGLNLAVECCFFEADRRLLLISDRDRWTWPRTAVRAGESALQAVRRLQQDLDIESPAEPRLFWVYGPREDETAYTAFYVLDGGHPLPGGGGANTVGPSIEGPGALFASDNLPVGAAHSVSARLRELALKSPGAADGRPGRSCPST